MGISVIIPTFDNIEFIDETLESELESSKLILSDTIKLTDFDFYTKGQNNLLNTQLQWSSGKEESVLSMNVSMSSKSRLVIEMLPSYFHLNKNRWDLYNSAEVIIDKNYIF